MKRDLISVVLLLLLGTIRAIRCMRSPCSYVEVCKGGSDENKEITNTEKAETASIDSEFCGDKKLEKATSKYRLFITLPNNTKVMKTFDTDDETITLKTAIDDILQELSISAWKLHVKRPLPQKVITRDDSDVNTSLLKLGNGMDITVTMSEGTYPAKPSNSSTQQTRKRITSSIRRSKKKRGKAMTLETSGHYAASDRRKKKNNEYSTGGSTVMLSGDEDDEDDDDDDDEDGHSKN